MKVSTFVPVAASAFDTDSVEGQRGRPSGVMRLDLLKVVGSRPAFLASPDGDSLARAASRSMAVQIWLCVSMANNRGRQRLPGPPVPYIGIITLSRPWQARGSLPAAFTGHIWLARVSASLRSRR